MNEWQPTSSIWWSVNNTSVQIASQNLQCSDQATLRSPKYADALCAYALAELLYFTWKPIPTTQYELQQDLSHNLSSAVSRCRPPV